MPFYLDIRGTRREPTSRTHAFDQLLRRSHVKHDDGQPSRPDEDPNEANDEAPETPLDEPAPTPIQDPPAEPDPHPYTVNQLLA